MTVPVLVESQNGTFTASVLGNPSVQATGDTKEKAVAALTADLSGRVVAGDLVFVDVQPKGLQNLAGKYKDDPAWKAMWDEIAAEIYRQRDEQKALEFPE